MSDVTDADREKAAEVLYGDYDYGAGMSQATQRAVLDRIAAALAEERAKARAQFGRPRMYPTGTYSLDEVAEEFGVDLTEDDA